MDIRLFDGTLRDAQGIIEVDRATFGDCHYAPEYIVALEADLGQQAWLAQEGGQIAGYVSAFSTHSLAVSRCEIDELAVRPASQGRGVGTQLVARAVAGGAERPNLSQARTLVAVGNLPSQRVFVKNGFSSIASVDMLLYQVSGRTPRPQQSDVPAVQAARVADAPAIADLSGCPVDRVVELLRRPDNLYLVARQEQAVQGCMELIHVRTLQYEGFWIESISVADRNSRAAAALFGAAIEEVKRSDAIDELGYLALPQERDFYTACVGEGFKRVDEYLVFVRELNSR